MLLSHLCNVAGFFKTVISLQILQWEKYFHIPDTADISENSKSLIKGLIQHQDLRLGSRHGATDIKKHPFFCCKCCTCGTVHCKCEHKGDCYFWRYVRTTKAPYVPNIMHELDTSNFEPFEDYDDNGTFTDKPPRPWIANSHPFIIPGNSECDLPPNARDKKDEYHGFYEFTFRRFFDDYGSPFQIMG